MADINWAARSNGDEPDANASWQDFINTSMPEPGIYQMSQLQQDMIRAAGPFQIKGGRRAWADVPELQDIGFHWQPTAIPNIFDIDPPGPLDFTFEEPHEPDDQSDDDQSDIRDDILRHYRPTAIAFNQRITQANINADLNFKVPRSQRAKITNRDETRPLLAIHEHEGGLYFG